MIGFSIAYVGSIDYVAAYGWPLYPFGYLPVFAFVVVAAETIRRHRLVDLTPAFAAEQILATLGDPVIVCDHEGRVRFTNPPPAGGFASTPADPPRPPPQPPAPPPPAPPPRP